ncbi:SIR2 family protein [Curtobacterium sp. MCPF17_050]|uniref:SIR2 family protein n=1 Tax=Curtobacterium sp. MCPF17_050 TaxID=2175664 RepID=UPI000D9D575C|nr:SIR2 family protein [Curtobacterium sp. MCPF17_050]WIB15213.1 SIR2 family protein [Curtobacterium sp. MCPF17_050]
MSRSRDVAVLVGNGLSIAFNPALNLRAITTEMVSRIAAASDEGGDVVRAMKEIAERALPNGVTSEEDFEILVGAFGAESRTMSNLEHLADLTKPQDEELKDAIKRVAQFAEEVRDNGLSHVLQVIFERSHAYQHDSQDLHDFVQAVVDSFEGRVTFANLNYDTLLLSGLINVCQGDLADMGHGYKQVSVTTEDSSVKVPALRSTKSDFPSNRRVRLLHLHGSVTFWSNTDRTIFAKLDRGFLETHNQWKAVRALDTNIRPVVVLANQRDKAAHVREFPFSLAYSMFSDSLVTADSWLIVGYSFRDEPVNSRLRDEFSDRDPKPRVLVVTHGSEPTRRQIERALGWGKEDGSSNEWLTIHRGGADGVETTTDWSAFIAK